MESRKGGEKLRSCVTVIGILLSGLSLAALITYAVLQAPSLRSVYAAQPLQDEHLSRIIYTYISISTFYIFPKIILI